MYVSIFYSPYIIFTHIVQIYQTKNWIIYIEYSSTSTENKEKFQRFNHLINNVEKHSNPIFTYTAISHRKLIKINSTNINFLKFRKSTKCAISHKLFNFIYKTTHI